jgi:hypothetical protein
VVFTLRTLWRDRPEVCERDMPQSVIDLIDAAIAALPLDLLSHVRAVKEGLPEPYGLPKPKWDEKADQESLVKWLTERLRMVLEALGQDRQAAVLLAKMLPEPWLFRLDLEPALLDTERRKWEEAFFGQPLVWLWAIWHGWSKVTHLQAIPGLPGWPGADRLLRPGDKVNLFIAAITLRKVVPSIRTKPGEAANYFKRGLKELRDRLESDHAAAQLDAIASAAAHIAERITAPDEMLRPAIAELLRRIPDTWQVYRPDDLTEIQAQALFLLTAAGMVERRERLRLKMFNHPLVAEATITATGEYGGAEALKDLVASMWPDWQDAFREWKKGDAANMPSGICERLEPSEWRLTDQGVIARKDLDNDTQAQGAVFDFVLRRGFFDGRPRLLPNGRISQRGPVRGKGQLVTMKKTKAEPAAPATMNVGNWKEGGDAFAQAFGPAIVKLFEAMQAQAGQATAKAADQSPSASKPAGNEAAQGAKAEADWRDVQARLLRLLEAGEAFTSQRDLAGRLSCSVATINKAIKKSARLKGWTAQRDRRSPKAQSLNGVTTDNTPSRRETDPTDLPGDDEVDRVMGLLVEQAKPADRAKLNALDADGRREIVRAYLVQEADKPIEGKAPKGNRLLGRKP